MNSAAFRHSLLSSLAAEIDASSVDALPPYAPTAELWQSAGVFITDDALGLTDSEAAHSGAQGVLTRHARPLSWLLFELRNDSRLTGGSGAELEFFGRLADAANGFLAAHQPETHDWRPLLLTVLREAGEIVRERFVPSVRQPLPRPRGGRRVRAMRLVPELLLAA